jgi:hypothetical protein
MKLLATSLVVVRDLIFSPLWKRRKTRSALLHMLPSRFKGWREVLQAEIGDPSKRNGREQDIFAPMEENQPGKSWSETYFRHSTP